MKNLILGFLLYFPIFLPALESYWKPSKYVWSLAFALDSDTPLPEAHDYKYFPESYNRVKPGDIVWVPLTHLGEFYFHSLPKIRCPFVLVTNLADDSFPYQACRFFSVNGLINHPLIIHIFAQNNALGNSHPKITSIPIGLDYHTLVLRPRYFQETCTTPQEQENYLELLLSSLQPTHKRIPKAFIDFHLHDTLRYGCLKRYLETGESRGDILNSIRDSNVVDVATKVLPRRELWAKKGLYAFSVSPHGNGLDAIRTWEDLVLGCIVIVKTSALDCLYEGLPVVIVQDWSEINEENMQKWLEQYRDAFTNPSYRQKLTHQHWMNKIREKAKLADQLR